VVGCASTDRCRPSPCWASVPRTAPGAAPGRAGGPALARRHHRDTEVV
ncbi:MAG: hypothetical protein AVDCRST_MAG57-8, partial [uncultured Blastococcus sp.]